MKQFVMVTVFLFGALYAQSQQIEVCVSCPFWECGMCSNGPSNGGGPTFDQDNDGSGFDWGYVDYEYKYKVYCTSCPSYGAWGYNCNSVPIYRCEMGSGSCNASGQELCSEYGCC